MYEIFWFSQMYHYVLIMELKRNKFEHSSSWKISFMNQIIQLFDVIYIYLVCYFTDLE